ncbi:MarR family transcriptional regulator [Candidatus Pelagibacter sp.]|nr:MarR family transcriptional regulator [Candidatus Pelagibacter sp.]
MRNKFSRIANDLVDHVSDSAELSFIFKTKIHVIIIFYIYGYEKITFEDLCKICNSAVSRTTIQTILSEGVKLGFLKKFVDKNDKRKKYFSCDQLKPILEKWHNEQQKIFN